MSDRSTPTGWGGKVVMANLAGLFFLIAAMGPVALLGFIDEVVSKHHPLDWALVGMAFIVALCLIGAAGLVCLGLEVAKAVLPPGRITSRPLAYALNVVMVPVLAVVAIPQLAITLIAGLIVRITGPILDQRIASNCVGCAYVRSAPRANDDPVFCEQHDRFFGGDVYRLFLSNEGE
jgi:hypothetical protein